jgi:hypothetical protein
MPVTITEPDPPVTVARTGTLTVKGTNGPPVSATLKKNSNNDEVLFTCTILPDGPLGTSNWVATCSGFGDDGACTLEFLGSTSKLDRDSIEVTIT